MKPLDAPFSATELSSLRACEGAFAARYHFDEWPREQITGAFIGTKTHGMLEAYAVHGQVPTAMDPVAMMFVDALPHIAPPGSHWMVEKKLHMEAYGFVFELTPDWYGHGSVLPGADPSLPAVQDFKTSKDPKAYGVHEREEKLDDVQTLIYAYALLPDGGYFQHLYMRKTAQVLILEAEKLPRCSQCSETECSDSYRCKRGRTLRQATKQPKSNLTIASGCVLTRDEIRGQFERIVVPLAMRAQQMRARRYHEGKVHPLTTFRNPATCEQYGGCPHKSRCAAKPFTHQEMARAYAHGDEMSFNLMGQLPPSPAPQAPAQGGFSFAPQAAPPAPAQAYAQLPPINGPQAAPQAPQAPAQGGFSFSPQAAPQAPAPQQLTAGGYVQTSHGTYVDPNAPVVTAPPAHLVGQVPATVTPSAQIQQVATAANGTISDAELGAAVRKVLQVFAALVRP